MCPLSDLQAAFERFATLECASSDLYQALARQISRDEEILAIARAGAPFPQILLFAAVQYLLLQVGDPLAEFYPSLTERPRRADDAYPSFRAFCVAHREELSKILSTRRLQTNEVRRCSTILPALMLVYRRKLSPLAIVEVGASAGLNLLFDKYRYEYDQVTCGPPASPVVIRCAVKGRLRPPIFTMPPVAYRLGIDLHPVNLRDEDNIRWLQALIWPEHHQRRQLLHSAIAAVLENSPPVIAADASDVLPGILASIPKNLAAAVVHTYTLNQFTREARRRFEYILRDVSLSRDVFEIAVEWIDTPTVELRLTQWREGQARQRSLAAAEPHGSWIEWWLPDGAEEG